MISTALLALVQAAGTAIGAELPVPARCIRLVADALPGWAAAPMSAEAVEWATREHLNPWVAVGDFDGDGRRDWAVLGEHDGRRKVAVCLNPGRQQRLLVIDEPYCSDVIWKTKAGSVVYDVDTGNERRIRADGLSTYCVGKAGAIYVLESGRFVEIVDSD